jgi:origin recognition complex subunit 4
VNLNPDALLGARDPAKYVQFVASINMSDFEPSPRSSKRREVTTYGTASAKANATPSATSSISKALNGISRRLFRSRDSDDELVDGGNTKDSAYGSKEDSLKEEETACAATVQVNERRPPGSESADELAQSEVTVTPTKVQRKSPRQKERTPKTTKEVFINAADDEKAEERRIETRSSGRERKRPRRYSGGLGESAKPGLPKGILTPSRKGNNSPRKSVAFEQDTSIVEENLGFKDLDRSTKKKTERARRQKVPLSSNETKRKGGKDSQHTHQANAGGRNLQETEIEEIEEEPPPYFPELPDIITTTSRSSPPAPSDAQLDPAKSLVLSRLTGQSLTPLTMFEAEYSKLHSLLLATIKAGEGNSILLLGSRGVGKTCMVETAIADLASEHAQDFHVIRLNGFLQTDDKLALREIWRQLGREMQVEEDETAQVNTYADTMASLLHILSHPEELAETLEPDTIGRTTKSVVFVLDEFDLFTTHPRQTLLYNLFDIAQARKAPIAVLGCSARVDVSDLLEKRVKSRFSHRWMHLSQARSLSAFEEIAKAALLVRELDSDEKQSISSKTRIGWNDYIEVY